MKSKNPKNPSLDVLLEKIKTKIDENPKKAATLVTDWTTRDSQWNIEKKKKLEKVVTRKKAA